MTTSIVFRVLLETAHIVYALNFSSSFTAGKVRYVREVNETDVFGCGPRVERHCAVRPNYLMTPRLSFA